MYIDNIDNIAKKKDLFHKPFFFFSRGEVLCTYPVILSLNIVLEGSGPVYNLITRNYATDFNMNFLEVSLLL